MIGPDVVTGRLRRRTWPSLLLVLFAAAACSPGPSRQSELEPFRIPQVDLTRLPELLRIQADAAGRKAREHPEDAEAIALLGLHYLEYDFPIAAARCLDRASQLEPGALRWKYLLGVAWARAGDRDETLRAYEAAAAIDDTYAPLLLRLADALIESDPERAAAYYRRVLASGPGSARASFGLGRATQDDEAAIAHFRDAVRAAPGYAEAHYALAMKLAARGASAEAAEHLDLFRGGGSPPVLEDPILAEMKARVTTPYLTIHPEVERLVAEGRVDEAIALVQGGIETDVSAVTARKELAKLLGFKGRHAESVAAYRAVLRDAPGDLEARVGLGRALEESGDRVAAEAEYRRILEQHPGHAPAQVSLGRLLAAGGQVEEGLEMMRRGVESLPGNGFYHYVYGVGLAQAGRERLALEPIRKAALLMPDHAGVRYTLGQLLLATGDADGARSAWLEAVDLAPGHAEAWIGLAHLSLMRGDVANAVAWAEKGCELRGFSDRSALNLLARAYDRAGRTGDAARVRARMKALP